MAIRTIKSKPIIEEVPAEGAEAVESAPAASRLKTTAKTDPFVVLLKIFSDLQSEFELLQKEITQTKDSWSVEQKTHVKETEDRNIQEEVEKKRNKEAYEYETSRKRKIEEDEFADKKANWEKELNGQKEILEKEKTELEQLRKLVVGFENEKDKAISIAQEILQKELVSKFETERKLREQENKSEKDILNIKINNLTAENNRLNTETEVLKKALEEATKQVKEIAVKVIESGTKSQPQEIASTQKSHSI